MHTEYNRKILKVILLKSSFNIAEPLFSYYITRSSKEKLWKGLEGEYVRRTWCNHIIILKKEVIQKGTIRKKLWRSRWQKVNKDKDYILNMLIKQGVCHIKVNDINLWIMWPTVTFMEWLWIFLNVFMNTKLFISLKTKIHDRIQCNHNN